MPCYEFQRYAGNVETVYRGKVSDENGDEEDLPYLMRWEGGELSRQFIDLSWVEKMPGVERTVHKNGVVEITIPTQH
jgi:hypothetical protein